ncbi:MAG: hypothetical protein ACK40E_03985 [Caldimicrobium sp.]
MKQPKILTIFLLIFFLATSSLAWAGAMTFTGTIKKITMEKNVATVVVTKFSGEDVTLTVEDEKTLAKFKAGTIKEGDEVNVKYEVKDGKNLATSITKPGGC